MNIFAAAPKVEAKSTKAKKSDNKATVTIQGLDELAAIDAAMKSLKAIRDTLEADVKMAQKEHFVQEGMKVGKRPATFKGVENIATATCELRARASTSPLSDAELELFEKHEIPTTKVDITPELYRINPAYLNDSELLQRVSNAIVKVKDVPADFIQHQLPVSKHIVADTAFDVLFQKEDANLVSTLLPMVGVLAIKANVGDNINKAMEIVSKILFGKGHNGGPKMTD